MDAPLLLESLPELDVLAELADDPEPPELALELPPAAALPEPELADDAEAPAPLDPGFATVLASPDGEEGFLLA